MIAVIAIAIDVAAAVAVVVVIAVAVVVVATAAAAVFVAVAAVLDVAVFVAAVTRRHLPKLESSIRLGPTVISSRAESDAIPSHYHLYNLSHPQSNRAITGTP